MNILALTQPTSREYIKIWCQERGVELRLPDSYIHPPEDAFAVSQTESIFAVADGVTMLGYLYDEKGEVKKKIEYPRESAAAKAARIFCDSSVRSLESGQTIAEAFSAANSEIGEMNKNEGRIPTEDYFYDYPGSTVGVAAKIEKETLEYGFIADCGLLILDNDGRIKFQTPNRLETEKIFCREWLEQNGFKWGTKTEYIRLLQRECINHPERKIGNCLAGYGHLNGNAGALGFIELGETHVAPGETIVLYSDGFDSHFKHKDFRRGLVHLDENSIRSIDTALIKKDAKTNGSERTLIAIKVE